MKLRTTLKVWVSRTYLTLDPKLRPSPPGDHYKLPLQLTIPRELEEQIRGAFAFQCEDSHEQFRMTVAKGMGTPESGPFKWEDAVAVVIREALVDYVNKWNPKVIFDTRGPELEAAE